MASTLLVNRLSRFSRGRGSYGSALPVPQYTRSSWGSYEPERHVGPPPCVQASLFLGHVSEPGSPGAGMVYRRHNLFPVSGSHPSRKPRVVDSPPAMPEITTPLATMGPPVE